MADARLRGEWLGNMKFDMLSDKAWRVFTSALMWSTQNGTDGFIPDRYHKMLHPDGADLHAEQEVTLAGLWEKTRDDAGNKGYQLIDWDGALGQSTAVQVETYKENGRKRARAYREREQKKLAKAVGFSDSPVPPVTGDVTRDVREYVGKGKGKGTVTQPSSVDETEDVNQQTGEVSDVPQPELSWHTAAIPNSDPMSDPGYCEHGMTIGKHCSHCERERKAG